MSQNKEEVRQVPYRKKDETIKLKQDTVDVIRKKYVIISPHLSERGKRLFAATEALALGHKGVTLASEATGLSRVTVTAGCRELKSGEMLIDEKARKSGGGRKAIAAKHPGILNALTALIEPSAFGDPEKPLQWTCKSQRNLADELKNQGFDVSHMTVGALLEELGYSLQSNKKSIEGLNHIDRDAQFEHISQKVISFQEQKLPVISVDTKKKELVGNYKNNGRTYRPEKTPVEVNIYDFPDKELGKVNPYGVYDISNNVGWVNLGIDHDTAEFAVESIRRWYFKIGKETYPLAQKLLITADGGGSNGSRVRLWKTELQALATELNLEIHVCHFPPGASKWNKIEHRLFSFISHNWRGHPLISHEVIIQLISSTTTKTGLKVLCELDTNSYQKGIKVSDEELHSVNIEKDNFHGEWNYKIKPAYQEL